MESELERRIYEKAFAFLKNSTKVEFPNPKTIHRMYSEKNFNIHELKIIMPDNLEKYSINIYRKQRLPLIQICYWNKRVFSYRRVTKNDKVRDKVYMSNKDNIDYWDFLLEDTAKNTKNKVE